MFISNLKLYNFRNYSKLDISFNNHLNFIIGNNAQGKTNIIEAIYYLSVTKSLIYLNDKNLIKHECNFCSILGLIKNNNTNLRLKIELSNNLKKLYFNDNLIKKHSDYIGKLKAVIFTPDSLNIIKSNPGNRRRFLNIDLSQLYNRYLNVLNNYNILLKQRNEYLKVIKTGSYNIDYFQILTEKLIDLAIIIFNYRNDYINLLNSYLNLIYKDISGFDDLKLVYDSVFLNNESNIKKFLTNRFNSLFSKEVFYGFTLIGPHKDDFKFILGNEDLLLHGSQGQLKLAVLSLKLAELYVFNDISNEYPILLLDDLFSELDNVKKNNILRYINNNIQTFITSTNLDNISTDLLKDASIFEIENGKVINFSIMKGRDSNE